MLGPDQTPADPQPTAPAEPQPTPTSAQTQLDKTQQYVAMTVRKSRPSFAGPPNPIEPALTSQPASGVMFDAPSIPGAARSQEPVAGMEFDAPPALPGAVSDVVTAADFASAQAATAEPPGTAEHSADACDVDMTEAHEVERLPSDRAADAHTASSLKQAQQANGTDASSESSAGDSLLALEPTEEERTPEVDSPSISKQGHRTAEVAQPLHLAFDLDTVATADVNMEPDTNQTAEREHTEADGTADIDMQQGSPNSEAEGTLEKADADTDMAYNSESFVEAAQAKPGATAHMDMQQDSNPVLEDAQAKADAVDAVDTPMSTSNASADVSAAADTAHQQTGDATAAASGSTQAAHAEGSHLAGNTADTGGDQLVAQPADGADKSGAEHDAAAGASNSRAVAAVSDSSDAKGYECSFKALAASAREAEDFASRVLVSPSKMGSEHQVRLWPRCRPC